MLLWGLATGIYCSLLLIAVFIDMVWVRVCRYVILVDVFLRVCCWHESVALLLTYHFIDNAKLWVYQNVSEADIERRRSRVG